MILKSNLRKAEITEAREQMRQKIADYIRGKDTEERKLIVDHLPTTEDELKEWQSVAVVGTSCVNIMDLKTRLLLQRDIVEVVPGLFDVPTRLVSAYLKFAYPSGQWATTHQYKICENVPEPPLFVRPGTSRATGYMVDIRRCYFDIMRIAGWDVDYYPGFRGTSPGRPPYDWPWPEHKVARNSLVSLTNYTELSVYRPKREGRKIATERRHNFYLNSPLRRLIADVTHAIAYEWKEAGCVYFNTDGGIAPNFGTMQRMVQIAADWGLRVGLDRKKQGPTEIYAAGNYKIGSYESKPYQAGHREPLPAEKIIQPLNFDSLKRFFGWASARAIPFEEYYND